MLLYGDANNIQYDCQIYNFCSLREGFKNLGLIPPNNLGAMSEYDFDIKYFHYIFDNDKIFMNLMKVIMDLYYGKNVYLIISDINNNWCSMITESLMKLIQQRYGIVAIEVNCLDDVIFAEDSTFNPYWGLVNLDEDKNRYIYLCEAIRLSTGGLVYSE